jgi:ribosomal protein S18 acetylase RimI-like enzyme
MKYFYPFFFIFCLLLRTQAFAEVTALKDLPASEWVQIKEEIVHLAQTMFDEGLIHSPEPSITIPTTIFPIHPRELEFWYQCDQETGLSQVFLDDSKHVQGFLIAHPEDYEDRSGKIIRGAHIEKFGVSKELRRAGVGKMMMNKFAESALIGKLLFADLLVLKTNSTAQAAYTRYGFKDTTDPRWKDDPRNNAFQFLVEIEVLFSNTKKIPTKE